MSPEPESKEGKEITFFKEVFNNLLGQYISITQTLMSTNFQNKELKKIKKKRN